MTATLFDKFLISLQECIMQGVILTAMVILSLSFSATTAMFGYDVVTGNFSWDVFWVWLGVSWAWVAANKAWSFSNRTEFYN